MGWLQQLWWCWCQPDRRRLWVSASHAQDLCLSPGVSIFEFQVSYFKGTEDHQMDFGIYELGKKQNHKQS